MCNNLRGMKERESGIELLRLVAIIIIIASHSLPFYGDPNSKFYINLNFATSNLEHFIMIFIKYFGQIGNCIFMVISSWFLLEDGTINKKKIQCIVIDSFVFSVGILLIAMTIGLEISNNDIIKQFFPISFQNCWYIGCYLFLYTVHPCLNKIIAGFSQKIMLRVTMTLFLLYSCMSIIIREGYYYNYLIAFIMIYFIVAYMKKYLQDASKNYQINFIIAGMGVFGIFLSLVITNLLGLRLNIISDKMLMWNIFSNPFIILISIGCFNLFRTVHFKSAFVNLNASLSLYVYMIHENPIVCADLKPIFFKHILYGASMRSVIILMLITIFSCFPLSLLYKMFFQYYFLRIGTLFFSRIETCYLVIEKKLLKMK